MSAEAYIQTAIGYLQTAQADMHAQMAALHKQADARKSQLQGDIHRLEQERGALGAEITQLQDDVQRHVLQDRFTKAGHEIDAKKVEMGQVDSQQAPVLQRKDVLTREIIRITTELQRVAGIADLH